MKANDLRVMQITKLDLSLIFLVVLHICNCQAYFANFCLFFFYAEELSDLQGQMKLLEEKNTKYMQQQIEMEEVSDFKFVCVCAYVRLSECHLIAI